MVRSGEAEAPDRQRRRRVAVPAGGRRLGEGQDRGCEEGGLGSEGLSLEGGFGVEGAPDLQQSHGRRALRSYRLRRRRGLRPRSARRLRPRAAEFRRGRGAGALRGRPAPGLRRARRGPGGRRLQGGLRGGDDGADEGRQGCRDHYRPRHQGRHDGQAARDRRGSPGARGPYQGGADRGDADPREGDGGRRRGLGDCRRQPGQRVPNAGSVLAGAEGHDPDRRLRPRCREGRGQEG
mmetsp:Transcript_65168/g.187577  ORF Transcript_65168/g.187577 Transcript_65168/m.187577 type:complete len:236 (+) Transcript_65168:1908-2615(+)